MSELTLFGLATAGQLQPDALHKLGQLACLLQEHQRLSRAIAEKIDECKQLLQDLLGYRQRLEHFWKLVQAEAEADAISDYQAMGELVRVVFGQSLFALKHYRDEVLARAEALGYDMRGADQLRRDVIDIEQLRDRILANWPWPNAERPPTNEPLLEAATLACRNGNYQTVEEVLRDIQGDSPSTH